MKTYWFTVAVGQKYLKQAKHLCASARPHGIEISVLRADLKRKIHRHPKSLKIQGILDAPSWADFIVFLDSDTLILDPAGYENEAGAVLETWKRPDARMVGVANIARYDEMVSSHYHAFQMSDFRHQSWNSGVIMGPRKAMLGLAMEWKRAWDLTLEAARGHLHRDQASFRLAYHHEFWDGTTMTTELAREWNWILKRWGVNENAHILHAGGEPIGPGKRAKWEKVKRRIVEASK